MRTCVRTCVRFDYVKKGTSLALIPSELSRRVWSIGHLHMNKTIGSVCVRACTRVCVSLSACAYTCVCICVGVCVCVCVCVSVMLIDQSQGSGVSCD